jgi:dye decolorizing peroxidase
VATAPTTYQTFVGLDLRRASRDDAAAALRLVTDDAARLTQGAPALGDTEPEIAANPAGLTVTAGIARQLLERVGLHDRIPPQLAPIPAFATDRFEDPWEQTDLLLQVGSDDPLTLAHTVRMLTKDLSTLTTVRWVQPGFRSPSPALPGSHASRNLMGQVDGTVNPRAGTPDFDEVVWLPDGSHWWANGTVLVLRRIRMLLDTWEILDRSAQEAVIGRRLDTGAPIGAMVESDPVPFDGTDDRGLPLIAQDAHVRVAHAKTTPEMILRRPYSYDAGMRDGTNDVGLLFAAYMQDPRTSFIPMQQRIAASDAFNRWNTTIGSASYLLPGGVPEGGVIGEAAFA